MCVCVRCPLKGLNCEMNKKIGEFCNKAEKLQIFCVPEKHTPQNGCEKCLPKLVTQVVDDVVLLVVVAGFGHFADPFTA